MNNFEYYNPTRIIFGQQTISRLNNHIPASAKVLMCYGGGSIKKNGVYDQVITALGKRTIIEFGGIEPNPDYDHLMKAIAIGRQEKIDFILAVGGGSVIDGAKLIAVGIPYPGDDVWAIVCGGHSVKPKTALPLGTVLTLPGTGSEMNGNSVISRHSTREKRAFASKLIFPKISILDPTTTFSLPQKQVRNGIVDAYVHVIEQYLTYPVNSPLQDRQAEGILLTLQEIGERALETPPNYDARANLMWSATNALNKLICMGVPEDWTTHSIGHELTAFYGLDHAESLAVVLPYLLWVKRDQKKVKLPQYGRRVWGLSGNDAEISSQAIEEMSRFFNRLGMPTRLTFYDIDPDEAAKSVRERFEKRGSVFGEKKDITPGVVAQILRLSR